MSFKDRCWTEIDRSALRENLRILQSCVPDGCRLMGIVKADGYGHGAAEVAALFAGIPGSWLGVACLQEALDLRRAGIDLPILILGYTPPRQAAVLAENQLTQALLSPEYTALLALEAKRQGRGRRALRVALPAHRRGPQRRHLQHPPPGGAHLSGRITDE